MIEYLKKYLIKEDNPEGSERDDYSNGWYAGNQLKALRFYLNKKVKIIAEYMEDAYEGECIALLKVGRRYFLWKDSFGSCSGCDALENENGYEYIKDTMSSVKEFKSLKEVKKYLSGESERFDWSYSEDVCKEFLDKLNTSSNEGAKK